MRIWLVPPSELDNKRLVAAHHEWHVIWNKVTMRGQRWLGWEALYHRKALYNVHQKLILEMKVRGMFHGTPVEYPEHTRTQISFPYTQDDLFRDRMHLWCRWNGSFHGRQMIDSTMWEKVATTYLAQGGCLHNEGFTNGNMCAICKRYAFSSKLKMWLPIAADELKSVPLW